MKRQQEQFLRLKLQQQQQQQMLVDLQHSDKDEINDPQPSSQNISEGKQKCSYPHNIFKIIASFIRKPMYIFSLVKVASWLMTLVV